jgi:hypothetical protein
MRFATTNYPIDATWTGVTRSGKIVTIWLSERKYNMEIWRWNAIYSDGSGNKFDWATSYRGCVNSAPVIIGRFKRVKNVPPEN